MSSSVWKYMVLTVVALALAASAHAQKFPERRHIRDHLLYLSLEKWQQMG